MTRKEQMDNALAELSAARARIRAAERELYAAWKAEAEAKHRAEELGAETETTNRGRQ
jgi:cob(I)alamin adenosyltransferase